MKASKKQVGLHFARAAETYDNQAMLQKRVADRLLALVDDHLPEPLQSVLEIGCCTGILTRKLAAKFPALEVFHINDLVAGFSNQVAGIQTSAQVTFLPGDIEAIPLPRQYQLIISSSTFHWLHDLPVFFAKLQQHLAPGGLLAFAMYGPENLQEIRALTGNGLEYLPLAQISAMLAEHFVVQATAESLESLQYPDPLAVLQHLRETGVNALAGSGWNKQQLHKFIRQYQEQFNGEKGVTLTYHPMYLLAQ